MSCLCLYWFGLCDFCLLLSVFCSPVWFLLYFFCLRAVYSVSSKSLACFSHPVARLVKLQPTLVLTCLVLCPLRFWLLFVCCTCISFSNARCLTRVEFSLHGFISACLCLYVLVFSSLFVVFSFFFRWSTQFRWVFCWCVAIVFMPRDSSLLASSFVTSSLEVEFSYSFVRFSEARKFILYVTVSTRLLAMLFVWLFFRILLALLFCSFESLTVCFRASLGHPVMSLPVNFSLLFVLILFVGIIAFLSCL